MCLLYSKLHTLEKILAKSEFVRFVSTTREDIKECSKAYFDNIVSQIALALLRMGSSDGLRIISTNSFYAT